MRVPRKIRSFVRRGTLSAMTVMASATAFASSAAADPSAVAAPSAAAAGGLTLSAALRAGADRGPAVAVAEAPGRALADTRSAARAFLSTAPALTAAAGPRFGAGTTLDVQVGLYVPISIRDVRGARAVTTDAATGLVAADLRRAKNEAAFRAATAWTRAVEGKELLAVRRSGLERVEVMLELAEKRSKSGVSLPSEVALARADRATAVATVLDAEGLFTEALVELRVATGLPPGTTIELAGDLVSPVDWLQTSARSGYAKGLGASPELAASAARARVARAEVTLVHASAAPSVSVGAMFAREGDGSSILLGQVSVPLPFVDPGAFDRARAEGSALAAAAQAARARVELEGARSLAVHEMDHTREVRATLERDALPAVREAERLAIAELTAGTSTVGPVSIARQRRLAVEETLTRARADVFRADLHFAFVTGQLLAGGT